jgi:hypothetical protein
LLEKNPVVSYASINKENNSKKKDIIDEEKI